MKNKIIRLFIVTALLLSIPLIAMQFTEEVNWDETDFIVMGVLILGIGSTYEFLASRFSDKRQRVVVGIVLAIIFLLIWAELAVGLFGTPFAGS